MKIEYEFCCNDMESYFESNVVELEFEGKTIKLNDKNGNDDEIFFCPICGEKIVTKFSVKKSREKEHKELVEGKCHEMSGDN